MDELLTAFLKFWVYAVSIMNLIDTINIINVITKTVPKFQMRVRKKGIFSYNMLIIVDSDYALAVFCHIFYCRSQFHGVNIAA